MFELNNQNDGTCFYCANGNRIYRYTQDWRPLLNILSVLDSCLYIWCYPPLARTHFTKPILNNIRVAKVKVPTLTRLERFERL